MWNKNNEYNSPSAMISRGLNPFIGSNIGAGVSRSIAGLCIVTGKQIGRAHV